MTHKQKTKYENKNRKAKRNREDSRKCCKNNHNLYFLKFIQMNANKAILVVLVLIIILSWILGVNSKENKPFSVTATNPNHGCDVFNACRICTAGTSVLTCGWCESSQNCFPAESSQGPSPPFLCGINTENRFDFGEGSCPAVSSHSFTMPTGPWNSASNEEMNKIVLRSKKHTVQLVFHDLPLGVFDTTQPYEILVHFLRKEPHYFSFPFIGRIFMYDNEMAKARSFDGKARLDITERLQELGYDEKTKPSIHTLTSHDFLISVWQKDVRFHEFKPFFIPSVEVNLLK
jgi:hypothetical protein